jgi:hypothetical protein
MSDPFASPRRRLARAYEHIANIKSRVGSYSSDKPYTRVIETNAQGFQEHKIKLRKEIPPVITDLAYEAIEAIRSSLDQAMYPIAVACDVKRADMIHFPIANSASEIEDLLSALLKKGIHGDIIALLRDLHTHQGGNDLIWALNRVRRQSAHRLIIPVATSSNNMFIENMNVHVTNHVSVHTPTWDSKKDEMIFLTTGPGTVLDYDLKIAFHVAFGETEGLSGKPVIDTLKILAGDVGSIIMLLEHEGRRISMFR